MLLTTSIAMQLMASLSWFLFQRKPSPGFLEIVGRTVIIKRTTAESDPAVTAEQTEDIFKSQSEPNALKILDILRGQTAHKAVDDVRKK